MSQTPKEYKEFCQSILKSFDKDWSKSELKLDFCYQFLNHIPSQAWTPMIRISVEKWEKGFPRNWTRAVLDIYDLWKKDAQFTVGCIKYNPDDDPRYPVNLMQQAFHILTTKDYPSYAYFCDQTGMPRNDRDRVENKHRICKAHEENRFKLPEIGQRTNRKQPRAEIARLRESFTDEPF